MIEIIMSIVLTAILASLFGQVMVTTSEIYADHNLRKTGTGDARRGLELMFHDLHEWNAWQNTPTSSVLDFTQTEIYQRRVLIFNYTYYDYTRTSFNLTSNCLVYQRADQGNFNNQMYIIDRGVVMGQAAFTTTTAGGKQRVTADIRMTLNGNPFRVRTTIFPRKQGG